MSTAVITSVTDYVEQLTRYFGSALPVLYRGHRVASCALRPTLGRLTFRGSFAKNLGAAEVRLLKFVIPRSEFAGIRDDLFRLNITQATMFPDLAGTCEFLTWNASPLPDEADRP